MVSKGEFVIDGSGDKTVERLPHYTKLTIGATNYLTTSA